MPGASPKPLWIGSTNMVEWVDMEHAASDSPRNDGTVTAVVKDSAGATVAGSSTAMSYVTGTNGLYRGYIASTISLTEGSTYYLEITASSPGPPAANGFRRITCLAQYLGA